MPQTPERSQASNRGVTRLEVRDFMNVVLVSAFLNESLKDASRLGKEFRRRREFDLKEV